MPSAEASRPGVQEAPPHRYRVAGLTLASEIALPSLFPCGVTPDRAEVELRLSPVPLRPPAPDKVGTNWAVAPDRFWLEVPGVGEFLAEAGRRLWVHPAAGAPRNDEAIGLVVAGTATAALVHQRNRCVFHASAVDVGGRAVLFMAPSGHGKSTLAARLTRHGHTLIADDLCRMDLCGLDDVRVHPDGRRLKLWRDAVDRLRLPAEGAILPFVDKFYVGADRRAVESAPVAAVYLMRRSHEAASASIAAATPSVAVGALLGHAFRPRQIARLGVGAAYLQTARALASSGRVFDLVNPFAPEPSGATPTRLLAHWAALGLTPSPTGADRSNPGPRPAETDGRDGSP